MDFKSSVPHLLLCVCVCGAGAYMEWSRMEWKMKRLNENKSMYFLHPNGKGELSHIAEI